MNRHIALIATLTCLLLASACGGGIEGATTSSSNSGSTIGATGVGGLAGNYGRACSLATDRCSEVPGARCEDLGGLQGVCTTYVVEGGGGSCPAATIAANGTWGPCVRLCGADGSCPTSTTCFTVTAGPGVKVPAGTRVCVPQTGSTGSTGSGSSSLSPIGGACTNDGQCQGSAWCATNLPGGSCTMVCTSNPSVCSSSSVCVGSSSTTNSFCFARCASPGSQSTCRTGYSCRALTGRTYGACM